MCSIHLFLILNLIISIFTYSKSIGKIFDSKIKVWFNPLKKYKIIWLANDIYTKKIHYITNIAL
jgi:hypothetical protein